MAPGPLREADRAELLGLARASIRERLHDSVLAVDHEQFPDTLRAVRATFVSLYVDGSLRGCIGTLDAMRPLVTDVTHNAQAAAFDDPRFAPLDWRAYQRLDIHISVLSVPERMILASEADLIARLRPHTDGLIIETASRRGTFLPAVWASLPDPREFVRQLKRKAGLAADYWSPDLHVRRYTVESIP